MSPTVFRYNQYRFLFFSREEPRVHIHVTCPDGEAKFWVDPEVALAANWGLSQSQINDLQQVIEERKDEIENAWARHFRS
ncbi:MAG: DUF4160 domain-containing protein [Phycisphaerae bacterium]|nr:DUF4160 domain-containing protein [Phycisphaerae bacterium]